MVQPRHVAWTLSAGLHLAAAAVLLHAMPPAVEPVMPVMLLEMPVPEAPPPASEPVVEPAAEPPSPLAPAEPPQAAVPEPAPPPDVAEAAPEPPVEPVLPPPVEVADLPVPPAPLPKPVPRQPTAPRRHVPAAATSQAVAEAPAPAPAPPTAATPAAVSTAPSPSYAAALMRALERHRRYPEEARWRRIQGVALLRFRMRRDGTVTNYRIERSAGDATLDDAVQSMIQSASPLPAPPDDMAGDTIELTVPVRFTLR